MEYQSEAAVHRRRFTILTAPTSRSPDPNNPGFFFPSGSNLIRGFETSLTGYITDELAVVTRLRLYRRTHHQCHVGDRRAGQSRATRAATISSPCGTSISSLRCGRQPLGVIYFSDSFASSDDTVRLPGFVRFDAAVYAKIDETWKAQLNIENIFNKGYWASADGNNNISPGQAVPSG